MKTLLPLIAALLVTAHVGAATPKEQMAAAIKAASTRYADDQRLCADERDSNRRMQCLRDARAEYDKALAAAKEVPKQGFACPECGEVVAVHTRETKGEGDAKGVLAGGAVGALLGNQVGKGNGRSLATIAGAIGGAYAGKKVQENMNAHTVWDVQVRFANGQEATYSFGQDPKLMKGDRVRRHDDSIERY